MAINSINLFTSQVTHSPLLQMADKYLRLIRTILLIIVLGIGCVSLVIIFYGSYRLDFLKKDQSSYMTRIQAQTQKEAMLLALRARVSSLKKIMEQQKSLAPYLDTTFRVALPPTLQSFTLTDNNSVRISLQTKDVDEALTIVRTIIALTTERKIRNPLFTALAMAPDGIMTFTVTFGVTL